MEKTLENVKKAYKTALKKGYSKKIDFSSAVNKNVIEDIFDFLLKKSETAKRLPIVYGKGDENYVEVELPNEWTIISISEPPVKKANNKKYYYTNVQDADGTVYEVRW